jgi:2-polyprenyl-3-methyl-5-hydroxy-6-metoxy-1,4-benzoquinol methylase
MHGFKGGSWKRASDEPEPSQNPPMHEEHLARLKDEREFFDQEEYQEGPIPQNTIERYTLCRKPFLPAEYPFWLLRDVRGRRVLEIGCGDGCNAILLALKGATVVGIDISPRAIEVARKRAAFHGVADRVTFHALQLESFLTRAPGRFDVICGFAILHHLCPVLDSVMASLTQLSHAETFFLFTEPMATLRWLRRLRLALPFFKTHGTENERPLERGDFATLRRYLPRMKVKTFGFLLRIWMRLVPGRYEDYSVLKRVAYDTLARVDGAVLSLPALQMLGSSAAIYQPPAGYTERGGA